jgi:hypothetical protein
MVSVFIGRQKLAKYFQPAIGTIGCGWPWNGQRKSPVIK